MKVQWLICNWDYWLIGW